MEILDVLDVFDHKAWQMSHDDEKSARALAKCALDAILDSFRAFFPANIASHFVRLTRADLEKHLTVIVVSSQALTRAHALARVMRYTSTVANIAVAHLADPTTTQPPPPIRYRPSSSRLRDGAHASKSVTFAPP